MSRDRVKESKIFDELLTANSDNDSNVGKAKKTISSLIPNDLKIVAKNDSQKLLINSIKNNEITICAGPAGSGKTFLAVAYALSLLRKTDNKYKKIYLIKSVVPLKGEDVGYLKGGLNEKIFPFFMSFYFNMEKIISEFSMKSLLENEIIKPLPLAYFRGITLDNCIIIADEIQNISMDNTHTLMTRIGSDCKLIMLGDTNQIDLVNKNDSSLRYVLKIFNDMDNIGVIEMDENNKNIRNPLIDGIEVKFKEYFNEKNIKAQNKHKKQLLLENNE